MLKLILWGKWPVYLRLQVPYYMAPLTIPCIQNMGSQIWINPGLEFPRVGDQKVSQVVQRTQSCLCIIECHLSFEKRMVLNREKDTYSNLIVTIVYKSQGKLPVYSLTWESKGSINWRYVGTLLREYFYVLTLCSELPYTRDGSEWKSPCISMCYTLQKLLLTLSLTLVI